MEKYIAECLDNEWMHVMWDCVVFFKDLS